MLFVKPLGGLAILRSLSLHGIWSFQTLGQKSMGSVFSSLNGPQLSAAKNPVISNEAAVQRTRPVSSSSDVLNGRALKRQRVNAPIVKSDEGLEATEAAIVPPPAATDSAADGTDEPPLVFRRKRKVAIFLGYIGDAYYGMQVNVGVVTIEKLLLEALYRAGVISDENRNSLSKLHWMRASRTDKGVSAAGQCVSANLLCEVNGRIDPVLIDSINQYLPEDIKVFGIQRATPSFNARTSCHRRRYEYLFPLRLLGGSNAVELGEDGEGDHRVKKLNSILAKYVGTHCFANFTEGLDGTNDSSKRYMIKVECGEPFLPLGSGVYYVSVCIYGQSFLLHQIRKMVGLALFVYLGRVTPKIIPVALSRRVKIPTPMAPSLGLLLDELYYDQYNKRHKSVLVQPITIGTFGDAKNDFKVNQIYAGIAKSERLNRTMENWIQSSLTRNKYDEEDIEEKYRSFCCRPDPPFIGSLNAPVQEDDTHKESSPQ